MASWSRWRDGVRWGAPPRGYPADYELTRVLRDGRTVQVRPVLPSDAPELAAAIANADPETLHRRFLGGRPPQTEEEIRHLVELDYVDRFALAAFDEQEQGVAIARYERDGPDVAEVAVAVDPGWRQVGLATRLLELLGRRAQECGIDRFRVSFFADNIDVQDLVDAAQLPEARTEGAGVVDVVVSLPQQA
jgi:GNAT superfamily N-acetyltransferase